MPSTATRICCSRSAFMRGRASPSCSTTARIISGKPSISPHVSRVLPSPGRSTRPARSWITPGPRNCWPRAAWRRCRGIGCCAASPTRLRSTRSPERRHDAAVTAPIAGAARPRIVYLYLAIVVVSWAGNWPLMKLALADAPPSLFVLLRLAGTLALMAPVLLVMREPLLPPAGERLGLAIVGQLQVAGFLVFGIVGL